MGLISIGEPEVLSPLLRTKVHVDHAGHSPPLVQWKDITLYGTTSSSPYQSNNLLTAPVLILIATVAGVVQWTAPSHTLIITLSRVKVNTHTRLEMVHAV
jgi:hypothetical protein